MMRGSLPRAGRVVALLTCVSVAALGATPAFADSIQTALARAYAANPSLNSQRASVRATDEGVPQAKAGYRPKVNFSADAGLQNIDSRGNTRAPGNEKFLPRGLGVTIDQTLYNGNKTGNSVSAAESAIFAARETLRVTEQTVLLNAATAFMNVLRDTAILNLRLNNVDVLTEQVRQTRDRFQVGEVTRTDVAQAEASLAGARSDASVAQSNLKTSLAVYRQVIGTEPKKLDAAQPVENLLPKTIDAALGQSSAEHPSIVAALHNVDAQLYQVKIQEAGLYPTVGVRGSVADRWDITNVGGRTFNASVVGTLSVPIYEGGAVYSAVRQAKETLAQKRIDVDTARDTVRQGVIAAWSSLEAAKAQILAGKEQVRAAEIALAGVREEAKVGQRTTLDVLNAQQVLLNARVTLITAQRDRVVASYSVLGATGRLSIRTLGLNVADYDAKVHFEQVKDKWLGLRTPNGQ